MSGLLSLFPKPWLVALGAGAVLVLALSAGFGAWTGYNAGFERAEALGQARLAAERLDRAEEETARALAVAAAERDARILYEEQVARNAELDRQLAETKATLAAERTRFNQRIANAAQAAANTCAGLPAEWVRLYNEAFGAGYSATGQNNISASTAQTPGSSSGSGSGLSRTESLTTPADILAHARDLGRNYQEMEAQLNSLIDAVQGAD